MSAVSSAACLCVLRSRQTCDYQGSGSRWRWITTTRWYESLQNGVQEAKAIERWCTNPTEDTSPRCVIASLALKEKVSEHLAAPWEEFVGVFPMQDGRFSRSLFWKDLDELVAQIPRRGSIPGPSGTRSVQTDAAVRIQAAARGHLSRRPQ